MRYAVHSLIQNEGFTLPVFSGDLKFLLFVCLGFFFCPFCLDLVLPDHFRYLSWLLVNNSCVVDTKWKDLYSALLP